MPESNRPVHVTLAVVFQVRAGKLQVLLWQRAREPFAGAWSLPGGYLEPGETLEESIRRHLAAKVDVRELSHLEQLETRSDPDRVGCTNSIPLQSGRLQGAAAGASDNKAGQRAAQRARDIPSCPDGPREARWSPLAHGQACAKASDQPYVLVLAKSHLLHRA